MISIRDYFNRFNHLPLAFRASIVFFLASFIQKGLNFISSPILTRILDSNDYGIVSVYYSVESLLGTVSMFCLAQGCFDIAMLNYKNDRSVYCFSTLILSNIITIITFIPLCYFYQFCFHSLNIPRSLFLLLLFVFLFQPAFNFWLRRNRFEYRYLNPGLFVVANSFIALSSSILCVFLSSNHKIEACLFGKEIPLIIVYISFWVYLAKHANWKISSQFIKFAFFFNLPLIPHYLSTYVLSSSDRLMIKAMVGASQAAYYTLSHNLSSIITIVWMSINASLVPFVLEKYENKQYQQVNQVVLSILSFFLFLCFIVILLAPELVSLMGPKEYMEAVFVVPPVIGGCFFLALYYVFTNVLYFLKRPAIVMYASITSASLNVLLNYIFISRYGYFAAGFTTLFCFLIQALIDCIAAKRVLSFHIYNIKFILLLSAFALLISCLSFILYIFNYLRYILLVLMVFLVLFKRDFIKQFLSNLFKTIRKNNESAHA